jgi:hypothetical protein
MKGCTAGLALAASISLVLGCSAGDDVVEGSRANCEFGGTLNDCPDAKRTAEGACWRLVDCGAIAVEHETDNGAFDWGNCVDFLDGRVTSDRRRLIVSCIAASTCDELRAPGSPDDPQTDLISCLHFGAP